MEEQIRSAIRASMKEIEEVQKRFDEMVDELPEQTAAVRERTRDTLAKIRAKLDESMREAGDDAQEAQVQAHLGLMEAQDRLEASRKVMDEYLDRFRDRSKTVMDETQLRAHLATMEAHDFWERRGQHLVEEFRQSTKSMQSLAAMAAGEIQEQFGRWNRMFAAAAGAGDPAAGTSRPGASDASRDGPDAGSGGDRNDKGA